MLIVVDAVSLQLYPEIGKLLSGDEYIKAFESYPDTVWVRADSVQNIP